MKPFKKTIISLGILILTAATSFYAGRFYEILSRDNAHDVKDRRTREFALRTERYQPSCRELTSGPGLVRQDNDFFFVHTQNNRFRVLGINSETGQPPVFYWWGADLANALKSCPEKGGSE